MQQNSTNRSKN